MTSEQEAREELAKLRKSMKEWFDENTKVAAQVAQVIRDTNAKLERALKSRYRWFLRWRDAEEELAELRAKNDKDEQALEDLRREFNALAAKIRRQLQ